MTKKRLREYLYLDEQRIRMLTNQISDRFTSRKSSKWSVGVSVIKGIELQNQREQIIRELSLPELIDLLTAYLKGTGGLYERRPESEPETLGVSKHGDQWYLYADGPQYV